jgi:hypothetical protein
MEYRNFAVDAIDPREFGVEVIAFSRQVLLQAVS